MLMRTLAAILILLAASLVSLADPAATAANTEAPGAPPAPAQQTAVAAQTKSGGCVSCHTATDRHTMHANPAVVLGCTDCHGGDVAVVRPAGSEYNGRDDKA